MHSITFNCAVIVCPNSYWHQFFEFFIWEWQQAQQAFESMHQIGNCQPEPWNNPVLFGLLSAHSEQKLWPASPTCSCWHQAPMTKTVCHQKASVHWWPVRSNKVTQTSEQFEHSKLARLQNVAKWDLYTVYTPTYWTYWTETNINRTLPNPILPYHAIRDWIEQLQEPYTLHCLHQTSPNYINEMSNSYKTATLSITINRYQCYQAPLGTVAPPTTAVQQLWNSFHFHLNVVPLREEGTLFENQQVAACCSCYHCYLALYRLYSAI